MNKYEISAIVRGTSISIALGIFAVVGLGMIDDYNSVNNTRTNGYSCKQFRTGTVEAIDGHKKASMYTTRNGVTKIEFNFPKEEALDGLDACVKAFEAQTNPIKE